MEKSHIVLITLIVYKLILICIGVWASKRTADSDDFFLGGRGLGPIVAALSYSSSAASAWVLLGLTGVAYLYGVSTIWIALGSITSMFVVWFWLAPRLMKFSRRHGHITLTEVVAHQTNGWQRRMIVWLSTLIIVASFVMYVAAQFQAAGNTFATSFDLSMPISIALGAFIIMLYTLLGGFWAVSVTDALQGTLMLIAALVMPIAAYLAVGGLPGLLDGLAATSTDAQLSLTAGNAGLFALGVVFGGLAIGFGTYGQPHLMARIMALRDDKAMRQARMITIVWYLIVFLGMWFVGLSGHVLHSGLENSEQIFFVMLDGLFPPVIGAIFLAAVLSAIMSTADSQLLSAAAAIANDLGLGGDNQKRVLLISRLTIAALVIASVVVAIYLPEKIFSRVLFAWMALGAAFGPTLFARLAGFSVTPMSVFSSILLGFGLTVILSFTPNAPGDIAERLLPFTVALVPLILFRRKLNA
ncbi:MAG: sodium/proline symporter [Arenicella sp.]|nr:sodium/proline symporter [Arenicella sp.]